MIRAESQRDRRRARVMHVFREVLERASCPFAAKAKISVSRGFQCARSLEENVALASLELGEFVRCSRLLNLDGFVLDLGGTENGNSVHRLGKTVRCALTTLSERDPAGDGCMRREIEDPSWHFSYAGERLFVMAFGSCYEDRHPRCTFAQDVTLLFFQPDHSFERAVPRGKKLIDDRARERARFAYEDAGRPYDAAISLAPVEAYKFVRPAQLGDAVVRWWECD